MTAWALGTRHLAIGLLVGGWLLASSSAAMGQHIGWSPSRDDAVILEDDAAVGTGIRPAAEFEEIAPTPGRRLSAPRPSRLMPRSSVGRMHEQTTIEPRIVNELPMPGSARMGTTASPMPGEIYAPGEIYEGMPGAGATCCGHGCGQCPDCCGNWNSCGPVPICTLLPRPCLTNLEFTAGVHGFTGPLNRGASGSFGFHEGFNFGFPVCGGNLPCGQIGALWTESNFDGSLLEPDERNQIFVTAGFFRRVDWGLQWGVAFDYLHDEWDYEIDLGQVRGELGWRYCDCHEIGFRFSAGVNDDSGIFNVIDSNEQEFVIRQAGGRVEVNDLFVLYYRRQFACGGEGRLFGGFTNNHQGIFGGDARLPLNACWSLAADFVYVVPPDDSPLPGFAEETWNVSIGLVWTPFAKPGCCPNYCRPLFDVANNGTFATRLERSMLIAE
ncbi:MAG: hypothetical protein L0211_05030 [Planctomycetaceae bacterium]|nr:hypothetical protein [Planctomycetaceae bacterium]